LNHARKRYTIMKITGKATITINAPAATIYDYLLDFTRHPEWVANLGRVWKVSDGPIDVGTRFRAQESAPPVPLLKRLRSMVFFIVGLAQGANSFSEAEILALEPGRRIAWAGKVARRQGDFNRSHWEIVLEPRNGATYLTQHFQYDPQTAAARRMVAALGGAAGIEIACGVSLARLQAVLEQRMPQPSAVASTPQPK
jgi:uncharacterized membrane protein